MSLSIHVTQSDYVLVCGYKVPDALKHVKIFVEQNVPEFPSAEARKAYVPGSSADAALEPWTKRKAMGGDTECVIVHGLPKGHHVLTLATEKADGVAGLTHVITF